MSYLLRFDGVDDYVDCPSWAPVNKADFSVRIDFETPVDITTDQFVIGYDANLTIRLWKLFIKDGNIGILHESDWSAGGIIQSPITASTRYVVEAVFSGTTIELYLDGALVASATGRDLSAGEATAFSRIGRTMADTKIVKAIDLYSIKLFNAANFTSEIRFYDPSASNGTGSVLPETTSAQDGTLVNGPQWVFYGVASPSLALGAAPQLGATLSGTGSNYAAQPTGPISITQGARSLPDMPITVSAWDAATGSFNWTTNAALPGFPANAADTTPFVLTGENVTITLPDPGA